VVYYIIEKIITKNLYMFYMNAFVGQYLGFEIRALYLSHAVLFALVYFSESPHAFVLRAFEGLRVFYLCLPCNSYCRHEHHAQLGF
jgi:hypothetical protein